jgi:hypothetical protein
MHKRRAAALQEREAEVSGLEFLKGYVCSPCTSNEKRESGNGYDNNDDGATTITISLDDIPNLYSDLVALKTEAEAQLAATHPKRSFYSRITRGATAIITMKITGLDVLKTYVCPPCNAKRQVTTSTTSFSLEVDPNDLGALIQALEIILDQIQQLLAAYGLELPLPNPDFTTGLPAVVPTTPAPVISTVQVPATPEVTAAPPVEVVTPPVANEPPPPAVVTSAQQSISESQPVLVEPVTATVATSVTTVQNAPASTPPPVIQEPAEEPGAIADDGEDSCPDSVVTLDVYTTVPASEDSCPASVTVDVYTTIMPRSPTETQSPQPTETGMCKRSIADFLRFIDIVLTSNL